jgi:hypothetical protein
MPDFDSFLMTFKEVDSHKQNPSSLSANKEQHNEDIKLFVNMLETWFNLELEKKIDNGKHVGYILNVKIEKNQNFVIYQDKNGDYKLCHGHHVNLVLAKISSPTPYQKSELLVFIENLDRLYQLIDLPMVPLSGRLSLSSEVKDLNKGKEFGLVISKKNNALTTPQADTTRNLVYAVNSIGLELVVKDGVYTLNMNANANRDFYTYTNNNRRWLFHREFQGVPIAMEELLSKTKQLFIFEGSINELKKCLEKRISFEISQELKNSQKAIDFLALIKKTINSETKFREEESGTCVLSTTDTQFILEGIQEYSKVLFFALPYGDLATIENGALCISESQHNTIQSLLEEQSFSFPYSENAEAFVDLLQDKFFLKGKISYDENNKTYTLNALGTDFIIKKLQNGEKQVICKFGSIDPVAIKRASGEVMLNNWLLGDIIENIDVYQLSRMRNYAAKYLSDQKEERSTEIETFWKKSDLWASTRKTIIFYVLQRMDRPEFISTTGQFFCCFTPSKTSKFKALNLLFQGKELSRNNLSTLANMGYLRDLLRDVIMDANNIHEFYRYDKHLTIEDLILALGYNYDPQSQCYKIKSETTEEENTQALDISILPVAPASPEIFKSPLPVAMTPYKTPLKPQPKGIFPYCREIEKTPIKATYNSLRDVPPEDSVEDYVLGCVYAWVKAEEQRLKQPRTKTPKKSLLTRGYQGAMASLAQFSRWNSNSASSSSPVMIENVVAGNNTLTQPLVGGGKL